MPAAGFPAAVSRTCVVSLAIGDQLLETPPGDVRDLLQRRCMLECAGIAQTPLHFRDHAGAARMQPQRNDTRKPEFLAIAAVQSGHACEFPARQAEETEPRLLAHRVSG